MFFESLKYFNYKDKLWLLLGSVVNRFMMAVPEHVFKTRNFLEVLKVNGYKVKGGKFFLEVTRKNENKYLLRRETSDFLVFQQIIINEEFKSVVDLIIHKGIHVSKIIDAGSNIGLTTLYFKQYFPQSEVVCIEPDNGNIAQLHENIKINNINNVEVIQAGIWAHNGWLDIDYTFRDGKEWSRCLKPSITGKGSIPVFTITELLKKKQWDVIDLLKIDVEGAENVIFTQSDNLDFLGNVRVITIEIHDPLQVGNKIIETLQLYNFKIYLSGELLIGVKVNG